MAVISSDVSEPVAIIAGRGELPLIMAQSLESQGVEHVMLGLAGIVDQASPLCQAEIRWDKWRQIQHFFQEYRVASVVFVGKVDRPRLSDLRPDSLLLKCLPKLSLSFGGDDQLMRQVSRLFEEIFSVRVLDPKQLLAQEDWPVGVLGAHHPNEQDLADIRRGIEVLACTSQADFGQSVIVEAGRVLGIEALEGTDALIHRCAQFIDQQGSSGVLIKMKKHGQDVRLDPPAIGIATLEAANSAGLSGLAIGRAGVLIIDPEQTIAYADRQGMFLFVTED